MLFARSATNCFSIAENTRPVLFQVMIPSQRAWCASATQRNPSQQDILLHLTAVSVFLSIPSLLLRFYLISFACSSALLSLFFLLLFSSFSPFLFLSACVHSHCFPISWTASHFSFLISPPSLPALLLFPSLILCASLSFICLSFAPRSSASLH